MPLPVFHSVASYSVYRMMGGAWKIRLGWKFLCLGIFLGILQDFDFLPGVFLGRPTLFHRDFSHSPFMALLVALTVGVIYYGYRRAFKFSKKGMDSDWQIRVYHVTLFSFLTYSAHLVLDSLSSGIPWLWPLTEQRFGHPIGLFLVGRGQALVSKVGGFDLFASQLISPAYQIALMFELLTTLYAAALMAAVREMRNPAGYGRSAILIRTVQVVILTTIGMFVI